MKEVLIGLFCPVRKATRVSSTRKVLAFQDANGIEPPDLDSETVFDSSTHKTEALHSISRSFYHTTQPWHPKWHDLDVLQIGRWVNR